MIFELVLLVFLLILAILFYFIVFKYKIFAKFEVKEIKFPPGQLIYTSYEGKYSKVGSKIESVISDLGKYSKKKNHVLFGIYYDDPCMILDANKSRAIVGIILFNSEKIENFQADEFIKNFEQKSFLYKKKNFQEFSGIGVKFPLYNLLNIMSGIFRGYPAIKTYAKKLGILSKFKFSFEVYDYENNELIISFPLETEADLDGLSGFPVPLYKEIKADKIK